MYHSITVSYSVSSVNMERTSSMFLSLYHYLHGKAVINCFINVKQYLVYIERCYCIIDIVTFKHKNNTLSVSVSGMDRRYCMPLNFIFVISFAVDL